jgi:hypothetical protein
MSEKVLPLAERWKMDKFVSVPKTKEKPKIKQKRPKPSKITKNP